MLIISDDTLNDTLTVYIEAYGKYPPVIAVTPASFTESLYSGDTIAKTLTISNTGASDLIINISAGIGSIVKKPVYNANTTYFGGNTNDKFVAKPTITKTDSKANKKYLVVQNFNPWGLNSNFDVLNAAGIPYDVINSADLATTNLNVYKCVMIVSVQDQNYYDNIAANNVKLAQYVSDGGILDFHACSQSGENVSGVTLPGGMKFVHSTSPTNYILEPTHPLVDGLPSPFTGNDASHNILTNIPANATLIVKNADDDITMAEYRYGNGTVVAMCQTLEFGYGNGWLLGGIINNAVTYCFNKTHNINISAANDTILPSQSINIEVVIDARNLIEGDYTGQIKIESNDPANPVVLVPVNLHVSGYAELVLNTDTLEFSNVFAETTDTLHKTITNDGMGSLIIDSIHCSNALFSYVLANTVIAPYDSINIGIVYAPVTNGSDTAVFEIFSNDTANPVISFVAIGHSLLPATISVNPTQFNYLLNTGQTAANEIIVENTGEVDLHYSFNYGQISHLLPISKKSQTLHETQTNRIAENSSERIVTDFCKYVQSADNKALPNILIMEDIPGLQPYYYVQALDSLNLDYTLVNSWALFNTYLTNGTSWKLAIVNSCNNTPDSTVLNSINTYLDNNGALLMADWALSNYTANPLLNKLGISFVNNYETPVNIGIIDSHYVASHQNALDSVYATNNINNIDGQNIIADTAAVVLGRYAAVGNPAAVLVENNRIFNTFQAMNYQDDDNSNGKADVQEFIENQISYLLAPWLKPEKISGTVLAGTTDTIPVLVDATTMQSGIYDADLNIYSDAANMSQLTVHYKLYVNGQPEIFANNDTVDFGNAFINYDTTISIPINNLGTLPLEISAISSDNARFTLTPNQMVLQSMTSQMLNITFNPQNVNAQEAVITLNSNDPLQPEYFIHAFGTGKYYDVYFHVTDSALQPLVDAAVTLGTYGTLQTNASGDVIFSNVLPDSITWTITKAAYNNATGAVVVNGVENVNVAMVLTTYTVTFNVTDGANPVDGATVALTGYGTQTSNASGVATFINVVPAAAIAWTVSKTGYNTQTGNVDVDGNETVNVTLPITTYTVTFNVTDGTNPIDGAVVALTGYGNQTTNASGVAIFAGVADGSHNYSITKSGYQTATGAATVAGANATVPITMNAYHTITFTITDSVTSTAVSGATITITGLGTQTTNGSGVAVFADVINGLYNYSIVKAGYLNKNGAVTVNNNNPAVAIAISPVGISEISNIEITLYPNPASTLVNVKTSVKMESVKVMDITGTIVKTLLVNAKTVNIDVADLAEGNYFIVIESNNGKGIRKLQVIK